VGTRQQSDIRFLGQIREDELFQENLNSPLLITHSIGVVPEDGFMSERNAYIMSAR